MSVALTRAFAQRLGDDEPLINLKVEMSRWNQLMADVKAFKWSKHHFWGYHNYSVVKTTIDQRTDRNPNGAVFVQECDHNLRDGYLRHRSFRRFLPDPNLTAKQETERTKKFYADCPRGFKGAVKENIRLMRVLFPDGGFGKHGCERRTGRNRFVKMDLVNKELKC